MQPKLEKVFPNLASSIFVKREVVPYMDYPWHYHPEFEIIFVEKRCSNICLINRLSISWVCNFQAIHVINKG